MARIAHAKTSPVKYVLLTSLSALALAACSGGSSQKAKSDAPMPPISEIDAAMNAPAPQPLSDGDTLTPVMPKAAVTTEERLAALEQNVEALRADFDRIKPAFASLNTTNERIQKLLGEVEQETAALSAPDPSPAADVPVTGTTPAPGSVSRPVAGFKTMPTVEEARAEAARQTGKTVVASPAAPAPSGATSVKGVRIGEHGSKTRIVLDLEGAAKPDFKYDIDNAENLLVVDLATTPWAGTTSGTPKSPLIASWAAQGTPSGGAALAVQLKKGARVVASEYLKPEGENPARLVIDIAAGG
jgi:hypothetical protein